MTNFPGFSDFFDSPPTLSSSKKNSPKQISKILGLPAKLIRSDQEVEQIRADRQAQQQQQIEMDQAVQESQVAKNAAPAAKVLIDGAEQPQ